MTKQAASARLTARTLLIKKSATRFMRRICVFGKRRAGAFLSMHLPDMIPKCLAPLRGPIFFPPCGATLRLIFSVIGVLPSLMGVF